jgi:hypothetical protein
MRAGTVITAMDARSALGRLLREKRCSPRAVLLSIRDYVYFAVPEPEILPILRIIGRESREKGTNKLGAKQIDQIVSAARKSNGR